MSTQLRTFMAVAKFKPGVTPEQIRELIPAEQAQARLLAEQGLLGEIRVAMPKRTVFLEAFAENEVDAIANLATLPLSAVWDTEVFETTPPAGAAVE